VKKLELGFLLGMAKNLVLGLALGLVLGLVELAQRLPGLMVMASSASDRSGKR
jgi:hypothetical protein